MYVLNQPARIYFMHKELTPDNVRFTATTTLVPEVGEVLTGFFGHMGTDVSARVTEVNVTGGVTPDGYACYDVFLTGGTEA
jgi:hypothetical protein